MQYHLHIRRGYNFLRGNSNCEIHICYLRTNLRLKASLCISVILKNKIGVYIQVDEYREFVEDFVDITSDLQIKLKRERDSGETKKVRFGKAMNHLIRPTHCQ